MTLYTSADGISWAPRSLPDAMWFGGVVPGDAGALYAVGTAAATAPIDAKTHVGDLVVAASSDGKTWKNVVLPLDLRSLAKKGANVGTSSASIARKGKTIVAAVQVDVQVDVASKLPAGVSTNYGVEMVDGVALVHGPPDQATLDCQQQAGGPSPTTFATIPVPVTSDSTVPPPVTASTTAYRAQDPGYGVPSGALSAECAQLLSQPKPTPVIGRYRLTDLGVDPIVAAQVGSRVHLFASDDGVSFEEVAGPGAAFLSNGGSNGGALVASSDGFDIVVSHPDPTQSSEVLHSVDGRSWTPVGRFENAYVQGLGSYAGRTVVMLQKNDPANGMMQSQELLSVSTDGLTPIPLPDLGLALSTGRPVSMGESGFATVANLDLLGFGMQEVRFTIDGYGFTTTNEPAGQRVKVVAPDGSLVADDVMGFGRGHIVQSNDGGITITNESGKVRLTLSGERYGQAMNLATLRRQAQASVLLTSPDGAAWSATKLSDLVDLNTVPALGITNVIVDKDRIIVTVMVDNPNGIVVDGARAPDTITFVGRRP
jgi:hypothetical protein